MYFQWKSVAGSCRESGAKTLHLNWQFAKCFIDSVIDSVASYCQGGKL
jgi:hypothetical protein